MARYWDGKIKQVFPHAYEIRDNWEDKTVSFRMIAIAKWSPDIEQFLELAKVLGVELHKLQIEVTVATIPGVPPDDRRSVYGSNLEIRVFAREVQFPQV